MSLKDRCHLAKYTEVFMTDIAKDELLYKDYNWKGLC